jgi:hypothetical protein
MITAIVTDEIPGEKISLAKIAKTAKVRQRIPSARIRA